MQTHTQRMISAQYCQIKVVVTDMGDDSSKTELVLNF